MKKLHQDWLSILRDLFRSRPSFCSTVITDSAAKEAPPISVV